MNDIYYENSKEYDKIIVNQKVNSLQNDYNKKVNNNTERRRKL